MLVHRFAHLLDPGLPVLACLLAFDVLQSTTDALLQFRRQRGRIENIVLVAGVLAAGLDVDQLADLKESVGADDQVYATLEVLSQGAQTAPTALGLAVGHGEKDRVKVECVTDAQNGQPFARDYVVRCVLVGLAPIPDDDRFLGGLRGRHLSFLLALDKRSFLCYARDEEHKSTDRFPAVPDRALLCRSRGPASIGLFIALDVSDPL